MPRLRQKLVWDFVFSLSVGGGGGRGCILTRGTHAQAQTKKVFSFLRFNLDLVFYFLILLDVSARTDHSGHLSAHAPLTRGP